MSAEPTAISVTANKFIFECTADAVLYLLFTYFLKDSIYNCL